MPGLDLVTHRFMPNHRFIVTVGILVSSFSSVSNIESSIEFDTVQEGGVNDHVLTWPKPTSQQHRLVLEKGAGRFNPLFVNNKAQVGRQFKVPGVIVTLGTDGLPTGRIYTFENPMIVRWEATNLDAMNAQVTIDRMEIVHDGLEMMVSV